MTQNTPHLSGWFVRDDYRAKAEIKDEIKHLEERLCQCMHSHGNQLSCPEQVTLLSGTLAKKYLEYLKLVGDANKLYSFQPQYLDSEVLWRQQLNSIYALKQQLCLTLAFEVELMILNEIASRYYQINKSTAPQDALPPFSSTSDELINDLTMLFHERNVKLWLTHLTDFWARHDTRHVELSILFRQWSVQEQQLALDYFASEELVYLVNAIFFYKLYPDKLFTELIHPEKLVSVRMRLGVLHHFIELLQIQLHGSALQYGLKPGIDHLFHGDELPKGIMIEVNEEFREVIQTAIKRLNVKFTPENEAQATLDRLHDLGRAYKFWFNPNRLIDAVMILQQRLVNNKNSDQNKLPLFHEQMVLMYGQLTTTECLDLYGYFANKDSRYLLYTLFTIIKGQALEWLFPLKEVEINAISTVFQALQCVMEALRVELKNRHVTTEPYVYDLAKKYNKAGRRNREAVFRIIAIYGRETVTISDNVEKLFTIIEENESEF